MLKQITIQDYAIVESLDIDLAGGMTGHGRNRRR